MTNIKKWPAMDPERIKKLQDYWENGRSVDDLQPRSSEKKHPVAVFGLRLRYIL